MQDISLQSISKIKMIDFEIFPTGISVLIVSLVFVCCIIIHFFRVLSFLVQYNKTEKSICILVSNTYRIEIMNLLQQVHVHNRNIPLKGPKLRHKLNTQSKSTRIM